MISSLATMLATHPSTTLLRYTMGVLPMSCADVERTGSNGEDGRGGEDDDGASNGWWLAAG